MAKQAVGSGKPRRPVYPFGWECYHNGSTLITREDAIIDFLTPYNEGADGLVIWGDAGGGCATGLSCMCDPQHGGPTNPTYFENIKQQTGPLLQGFLKQVAECSTKQCSGHGRCHTVPAQPSAATAAAACDCFDGYSGVTCGQLAVPVSNMRHKTDDSLTASAPHMWAEPFGYAPPVPPPSPLGQRAVPLPLIVSRVISTVPPPSAECAATLDVWCGNEKWCEEHSAWCAMHNVTTPFVAAYSTQHADIGIPGAPNEWRCYSPDNLVPQAPLLARKYHCPTSNPGAGCGDYTAVQPHLVLVLAKCDPSWRPPPEPTPLGLPRIKVIDGAIPTMVYLPPTASDGSGNGTLLAAGQNTNGSLTLHRSDTLGVSWSKAINPFKTPQSLMQPQLGYDNATGKVFLFFTVVVATPHGGGCDFGVLNELGFWKVESTSRGLTWSTAVDVQNILPDKPHLNHSKCVAPTNGAGIELGPHGPHPGRLVFSGQTDSYNGSVAVFSDTGGLTWDWTSSLHHSGQDECSIAQLANGSLMAIMRSCPANKNGLCQGRRRRLDDHSDPEQPITAKMPATREYQPNEVGVGNKLFSYAISNNGGTTFGPIRLHPDLPTPVCMSALFTHKSGALLFSGPYSTTERYNLTVLASLDNGVSFTRSLTVTEGPSGYSALQCGLPGKEDCGILYDAMGGEGLMFSRFAFDDLRPF